MACDVTNIYVTRYLLRSGREELASREVEIEEARATPGNPWHCRTISEHYLISLLDTFISFSLKKMRYSSIARLQMNMTSERRLCKSKCA